MTRWAVGKTRTSHELAVASRLKREGVDCYCPSYEVLSRCGRHRRASKTVRAGYPGYIFADYDTVIDEEKVRNVPDFHHFLRNQNRVSLLPDGIIEGFRALERQGIFLPTSLESLVSRFIVGDEVKVPEGIFGGWKGYVREVIKDRVKVDGGDFTHPVEFADLHLEPDSV